MEQHERNKGKNMRRQERERGKEKHCQQFVQLIKLSYRERWRFSLPTNNLQRFFSRSCFFFVRHSLTLPGNFFCISYAIFVQIFTFLLHVSYYQVTSVHLILSSLCVWVYATVCAVSAGARAPFRELLWTYTKEKFILPAHRQHTHTHTPLPFHRSLLYGNVPLLIVRAFSITPIFRCCFHLESARHFFLPLT